MRSLLLAVFLCTHALVSPASAGAQGVAASTPGPSPEVASLRAGDKSIDDLAAKVVAALAANDRAALLAVLIEPDDYRDVIIPSSVEPGQPWRRWKDKSRQFFTDEFLHKSAIIAERLLETYGGKPLQLASWRLTTETKRYAGYIAHGELRLAVEVAPPATLDAPDVLRLGYVAEVGGRFKLLGYVAEMD